MLQRASSLWARGPALREVLVSLSALQRVERRSNLPPKGCSLWSADKTCPGSCLPQQHDRPSRSTTCPGHVAKSMIFMTNHARKGARKADGKSLIPKNCAHTHSISSAPAWQKRARDHNSHLKS